MSDDDVIKDDAAEPETAPAAESAASSAGKPVVRRNSRMRRALLSKLPKLPFQGSAVADQFLVDEDLGHLDLSAEVILIPLEALQAHPRQGDSR